MGTFRKTSNAKISFETPKPVYFSLFCSKFTISFKTLFKNYILLLHFNL